MGRQKTHDEYIREVALKNPNIEVIDVYINANTNIKHRCKICNNEWCVKPSSIINQNTGCPVCAGNIKKTHDKYVKELKLKNPNIEVLGTYESTHKKIKHQCKIDGYIWDATPAHILQGEGCPKCKKVYKRNHIDYIKDLIIFNPNVEVVEEFVNLSTKILHKCKIHNVEWMATPSNILCGKGCYICSGEKISKSKTTKESDYVDKLNLINPDLILIGNFVNMSTKIKHQCLKCNYSWYVTPHAIISSKEGCPRCCSSKGEKTIEKYLLNNKIPYVRQCKFNDCKDVKPLPFDFYLPEHNVCIEYQGKQHYEPIDFFGGYKSFIVRQHHDKIKSQYCKNNNIILLTIKYDEDIEDKIYNLILSKTVTTAGC